ncbi:BLUF domain-containing protein [Methylotenera sp. L2L1]|uniref:BLUF domain-containing protein n=1 Tax=Methylotenera sp. L2L1 TaxID=1502770 RepID=UPI0005681B83|nr:BLUF domain-containing protein [Methylotenera sp. L2L1]
MIRLLYSSQAAQDITEQGIADILGKSQKNNDEAGITGILVYGGQLFMQVLEGPELAVLKLYVTICEDARNSLNKIIYISYTDKRMFGDWSMGIIQCDPIAYQKIFDLNSRATETIEPGSFRDTMRDFLRRLNSAKKDT